MKLKILKKIYMPRDNKITFTYICIFMRNPFIRGNHTSVHPVIFLQNKFLQNKVNLTYKTKQKKFFQIEG